MEHTIAVANIRLAQLYQLLGQVIQFLKVVAGICNLVWLKAEPPYSVQNRSEIDLFLGFGIGIVIPVAVSGQFVGLF